MELLDIIILIIVAFVSGTGCILGWFLGRQLDTTILSLIKTNGPSPQGPDAEKPDKIRNSGFYN